MPDLQEFPLYDDIKKIIDAENNDTYNFSLVLHTFKHELKAFDIISIDVDSDYEKGFSDVIKINATFPMGEFMYYMFPYKDMLEASLDIAGIETRYRVILPNRVLEISPDIYETSLDKEMMNETTTEQIQLQLVALCAEPARMATTEDVFRGKLVDIIPNVFKAAMSTIRVNGHPIITKVIMQDPDNDKEYDPFVIESHTPAIDLVAWIQNSYGIYYNGAGRFLTYEGNKAIWRIYDLYNPLRYKKEKVKIRCFLIPPTINLPMMNTWMEEGSVFSFIGTTGLEDGSSIDSRPPNRGIGFTYQTADKIPVDDVVVKGGIPFGSVDHVSKQVIFTKRPDTIVDKSHKSISNNKFESISSQASNWLGSKTIIWHSAHLHYLLPGSTLNLYTVDKLDNIVEYKCSILRTKKIVKKESSGVSVDEMKMMTGSIVLTLAILNRL